MFQSGYYVYPIVVERVPNRSNSVRNVRNLSFKNTMGTLSIHHGLAHFLAQIHFNWAMLLILLPTLNFLFKQFYFMKRNSIRLIIEKLLCSI